MPSHPRAAARARPSAGTPPREPAPPQPLEPLRRKRDVGDRKQPRPDRDELVHVLRPDAPQVARQQSFPPPVDKMPTLAFVYPEDLREIVGVRVQRASSREPRSGHMAVFSRCHDSPKEQSWRGSRYHLNTYKCHHMASHVRYHELCSCPSSPSPPFTPLCPQSAARSAPAASPPAKSGTTRAKATSSSISPSSPRPDSTTMRSVSWR